MRKTSALLLASVVALIIFLGPLQAEAASYPKKPITVISPYGPGGAADLAARTLAATVPKYIGKNLVVVNKAGAAGVVGSTFVAKGRRDGYTLLLARVGCQATVPAINKKIAYKWDDFTFLGMLELNPFVLTVSADSPYETFDDLKKALKDPEVSLSYSTAGVGTLLHLGSVLMLDTVGADQASVRHIPFKGGGKAGAAVVGGHVDIFIQNLSGVIGHIKSGKLRALAVTTPERAESLPDVPTFRELGHEDMEVVIGWSALYGPKGMKDDVSTKWVNSLSQLSQDEEWIKSTKDLGSIPRVMSPEDTKDFVGKQYAVFSEVVERLGLGIN